MEAFAIFLLKSSLFMAAFYMVYALWLRNETHFSINRIYLLLSMVTSMVLPFVTLPSFEATAIGKGIASIGNILMPGVTIVGVQGGGESTVSWMLVLYLTVSIGLLTILSYHISKIFYKIRKEQRVNLPIPGVTVVEGDQFDVPFSFFNHVHVPKNQYSEEQLRIVLCHEMVHVQKRHSADVVFAWVVCSVWWVNPFAWLLLRAIREVHEYEADSISKGTGASPAEYIRLMLETSMPGLVPALSTGFNKPLTLKRLAMITKEKSATMSALKYLLAIPAVLALVFMFSTSSCSQKESKNNVESTTDSTIAPPAPPTAPAPPAVPTPPDEPAELAKESEVFFITEKMPDFPYKDKDGLEGFRAYVQDNVKYPKEAMDKGIQGKVYVSFVVEADGAVSNVKVVRAVNKFLDEETVRAVKTALKWTPGEQKGKKVRVSFTIPVTFKLQ